MASSDDIRLFLSSRRARLTPARAGLPTYGRHRRVPGLRREEVALLAGISIDYYTRIERGNAQGVSDDVLDAIAGALQLDADERHHLENLVWAADAVKVVPRAVALDEVRTSIRRIVDGMTTMPALVRNRRLEILHANALGRELYAEVFEDHGHVPNPARYVFLDPRSREFFVDWDRAADDMVGLLRAETGRSPGDAALTELVDALTSRSEAFAGRWAQHGVRFHRNGVANLRHPRVGPLTLIYEDLDLPTQPDQTVLVFAGEPGSESEVALRALAEGTGTHDPRPA